MRVRNFGADLLVRVACWGWAGSIPACWACERAARFTRGREARRFNLSFTYQFGANLQIDAPRFLVADTISASHIFEDSEIVMAYTIDSVGFFAASSSSSGNIRSSVGTPSYRRVAAVLLDALGSNKARLSAALEVLDIKINPGAAASALLKQAQYFRDLEADSGTFAIAEVVTDVFSWRTRVWSSWFREFGF